MNLTYWIIDHIMWSQKTFGPGFRKYGILKHIRKELKEIEDKPYDVEEWADLVILAIDGASRSIAERLGPDVNLKKIALEITKTLESKQEKNFARKWPDWKELPFDQPIEHIRDD